MKLSTLSSLLTVSLILILSGCAIKPKPKDEAIIDPTLPKITLTKNGAQSTMRSVALEWKAITDKRVQGIYVYKKIPGTQNDDNKNFLDTINNRFSTHFLDVDVEPASEYIYYFKTYTADAESKKSKEYIVKTKPIFNSVSWIYAKDNMPRSAKIIWRPHKSKAVIAYIIQRKTLDEKTFKEISRVYGRLNVEYIDMNLKDNHTYMYQVRALTYDKIVSLASEVVTISTKALPAQVTNISATTNIAKKIELKWDKTASPDFSHYNVYRSQDIDGSYKLIAQVKNNNFVDNIEKDGEKYFYRVSVVDTDGLESKHDINSVLGMTLVRPNTPALVEATLDDNKIILKWDNTDKRTVAYTVIKKYTKGFFDFQEEHFNNIENTKFIDTDILPNTTYTYQVLAVDKNGILSLPSIEVKLETKEIKSKKKQSKKNEVKKDEVKIQEVKKDEVKVQEVQIEKIVIEDFQPEEI